MSWSRISKPYVKPVFMYMTALVILYQVSTILAFNSTGYCFEILMHLKIISVFVLKTAFLLYIAVFIGNHKLTRVFLIIHLISLGTILPYLFYPPYRHSIFIIIGPNAAQYGVGADIHTQVTSLLYVVSGAIFLTVYKPFRQIRQNLLFIIALLAVNIVLLSAFAFVAKDALHENTHVLILTAYAAFFLRSSPFFEKRDRLLSPINIIEGVGEAVIIIDKTDKAAFVHNGLEGIDINKHMKEVNGMIAAGVASQTFDEKNDLRENDSFIEGNLVLNHEEEHRLHYVLSHLYFKKTYMGKIIVLRDVTYYAMLLEQLNEKNSLLKEAFEKQKKYIKVARRLVGEEERARILSVINSIAGEYLKTVKKRIDALENAAEADNTDFRKWLKSENEALLVLTRKAIDEVRAEVKKLNMMDRQEVTR